MLSCGSAAFRPAANASRPFIGGWPGRRNTTSSAMSRRMASMSPELVNLSQLEIRSRMACSSTEEFVIADSPSLALGLVGVELLFQELLECRQFLLAPQTDGRIPFPKDFSVWPDEIRGGPTGDAVVVVVAVVLVPEGGVLQLPLVPVVLRLLVGGELAAGDFHDDQAARSVFFF